MATTTKEMDFRARALLCDTVSVADGKLYVHGGGWDQLAPPNGYPMVVGRIGLALLVEIPYGRTNSNHTLTVELRDEDGVAQPLHPGPGPDDPPVSEVSAGFNIGRPPYLVPGATQAIPLALQFDGLTIQQPGSYYFLISIDGQEVERATFRAGGFVPPQ
ncbi:hypothetical protein FDO65_10245 [Nakamurella flava]|uniref:Uncharacterized protein n=1 Tax=Nakamurella flava TaxID=2576308 RepID=A0A4V6CSJ8_9ACTN|nr:hypothetical protein [Nakamurella flava]TKV61895.1 hypothetical protein FDO65_10245 [Nakamurella flava]